MKTITLKPRLWKFYYSKTNPTLEPINWGFLALENNCLNTIPAMAFENLKA
jgi:hypothetical protein